MNKLKVLFLSCAIALFTCAAFTPASNAQVSFGVNIGVPPTCPYGYFDYAPYQCAPYGYYGPGYFYNGIFLGVGPWANWGYGHGWGGHRFAGAGGGHYVPGRRYTGGSAAYRGRPGGAVHSSRGAVGGHAVAHRSAARPAGRAAAPRAASHAASHASAPRGGGHAAGGHAAGGHAGGNDHR